ncbi:MAG: hypothetical protein ACUVTR_01945 [Dehalococcoidia bacterium]
MPDLYVFKAQVGMFDPVALQNQNVCIHYVQNVFWRKVDFLEAIPPFQCINLGPLAATSVSARTLVTNLEMPDNEFGLFRWYPIDDAQIRLFHPAGLAKWQLRNLQVSIDMNIVNRDPNLVSTEIAVWENNRPAMEAINGHAFALGAVRIIALGYRFHTINLEGTGAGADPELVKALKAGTQPCTHVWASGRSIGD